MKKIVLALFLFSASLSAQEYPMYSINTFSGVDFGNVGFSSSQGAMTQRFSTNVVGFGTSLNPYKGLKIDVSVMQRSNMGPVMLDASNDLYTFNVTQFDLAPTAQFAIENGGMFNFGAGVLGAVINNAIQETNLVNIDLIEDGYIRPIGFGGVLTCGYIQRISTNVNGFVTYKYSSLISNPETDVDQQLILTNNSIYAGVQVVF